MPAAEDERPETPLTPTEEERVRRLLADARHEAPMPPEVVARLDGVLADLATDRRSDATDPEPRGSVVDLADSPAARRRRRRVTQLLVAAAAVTVVGVGGPQLLGGLTAGSMDDAGGDAASTADREFSNGADDDGADGEGADTGGSGGDAPEAARLPARRLQGEDFQEQVAELRDNAWSAYAIAPQDGTHSDRMTEDLAKTRRCQAGADWPEGRRLGVTYDGDRGVLIFRQPRSGQQEVDLFLCGQDDPTRITVLPAP